MKVDYKCKFCGLGGCVEVDETPEVKFQVEKWKSFLACIRCAKFHTDRLKITEKITAVCRVLQVARVSNSKDLETVEAAIRTRLTNRTREYAELICSFHCKTTVWESDFVEMLMRQPDRVNKALNFYRRGIVGI